MSDYKQLLTDLSWEMGPCDREASEAIEALMRKVEVAADALRPFAACNETAQEYGHEPGSTCTWRISFDDTARALEVLQKMEE